MPPKSALAVAITAAGGARADVEPLKWIADHLRGHHVLDADVALEVGVRVQQRVLPGAHDDARQILLAEPVAPQVVRGPQGYRWCWSTATCRARRRRPARRRLALPRLACHSALRGVALDAFAVDARGEPALFEKTVNVRAGLAEGQFDDGAVDGMAEQDLQQIGSVLTRGPTSHSTTASSCGTWAAHGGPVGRRATV